MIKILIVDDEKLIRNGLTKIINKAGRGYYVCGAAENGEEAKAMIAALLPNVVISDIKMPELDGIGLITWMNRHYPRIRHIMLSGYEDAQLIISCLRLKTYDYLLKPLDKYMLFGILDKIAEDIKNESEQINESILLNEALRVARDRALLRLVSDAGTQKEDSLKTLEKYGIEFQDAQYRAMIVLADNEGDGGMEQPLQNDGELLGYAVRNISEEILDKNNTRHFSFEAGVKELVVFIEVNEALGEEAVAAVAGTIRNTISEAIHHSVTIGISGVYQGAEQFRTAYEKALGALNFRLTGEGHGIWLEKNEYVETENLDVLSDMTKKLVASIEFANREKAVSIIREICRVFSESALCPQSVYGVLNDIGSRVNIMLKEQKINTQVSRTLVFDKDYKRFESIRQIKDYITELTNAAFDILEARREGTDKKLVFLARQYVEKNYFNDITLQSVSEQLHISKSHFCEMFKKGTGETFIDFLTNIRIDKAKTLLLETDLHDYEVALMVGYGNATYFSKVFKKATGITPTQYRKLNQSV